MTWITNLGAERRMDQIYECRICLKEFQGKSALIEHLRTEHEVLEIVSYAATTMIGEQERDKIAREYYRQLENIKKELRGES